MRDSKSVDEYIAKAPQWARDTLNDLRQAIKSAAPDAKESISYHMPYYSQNGRLAYFGYHTNHCGFYWIGVEDKKVFADDLSRQKVVGNTLQIPRGEKVPAGLIKKIVKSRVETNGKK